MYIHHTVPVRMMLLDWIVLPLRWEIQILLIVDCGFYLPGHTRQEGKRGLTCSAKSQVAAANTTQQLGSIAPNCFRCY